MCTNAKIVHDVHMRELNAYFSYWYISFWCKNNIATGLDRNNYDTCYQNCTIETWRSKSHNCDARTKLRNWNQNHTYILSKWPKVVQLSLKIKCMFGNSCTLFPMHFKLNLEKQSLCYFSLHDHQHWEECKWNSNDNQNTHQSVP